jgi:hypothetical protein
MFVAPIIGQFWHEAFLSIIVAIVGAVAMWPIRKIKEGAKALKTQLDTMQSELVTQRTNCLTTLQNQGERQIELLEKTVDTLEAMHLDQRTLLGKLDK